MSSAKKIEAVEMKTTVKMEIPSESIGRIIGTHGVFLKFLNQIPQIDQVKLVEKANNVKVLVITGQIDAVEEVVNLAQRSINGNRKTTPGDVHSTTQLKTGKTSKSNERERKQIKEASTLTRSSAVDAPKGKMSLKQQKEADSNFAAARAQFEIVKAAREASAAATTSKI